VFIFDDVGVITQKIRLENPAMPWVLKIAARVWHGWLPVEEDGVFFEVKQDLRSVPRHHIRVLAPPEGDAAAPAFLVPLRSAKVGDRMGGQGPDPRSPNRKTVCVGRGERSADERRPCLNCMSLPQTADRISSIRAKEPVDLLLVGFHNF